MHAVVTRVAINDFENARRVLHEEGIPRIKQADGFVSGCWLVPTDDGKGMSVVLWQDEDAAKAMAAQLQPGTKLNDFVTIEFVEVREVAANA